MDFKQIEAFVNVVRYKSFSKAADATFFTQPTISSHISNLENELGVKLLERKGRTVEMTPQGSKFYKYAVEMINTRSEAMEDISANDDSVSGILEIQTSSIPGVTFLPEWLSEFRNTHNNVQYYVNLSDTQSVIDNLLERRGEIGFIGDEISNSAFELSKVASDKVVMIAPKSYDLPASVSMADIIEYPFIWRETGSATRKTFENAAVAMGYEKDAFEIAGLFNDLDSIIRSVETGLGVAIVSEKLASTLGDKVSAIEINDFKDKRDFYIVKLKNAALSPVANEFYNFVLSKNE